MDKMEINISTPFIKLDNLLKFSGIAESGSFAKMMIQSGDVLVNGEIELARGKKIKAGDHVTIQDSHIYVVQDKE